MSKYVQAASELLIRFGKPMHYTTIASAAIDLGLLESGCLSPEIAMSSALSKEVTFNPKSILKKNKLGVYDVAFGERIGCYLLNKNNLGSRLDLLAKKLGLKDESYAIKKSIFMTRRLISVLGEEKEAVIINNEQRFLVDFVLHENTKKRLDVFINKQSALCHLFNKKISIEKEICVAIEQIREKLSFKNIDYTLDYCVTLLEFLSVFKGDEVLKAEGSGRIINLRLGGDS
jgi:hypothetical protein